MKIRNGFVSNSSSSSYVLAFDKTKVLTNPQDIVNFIDNNPRQEIFFVSELCDGQDIFSLSSHQKRYLLKHRKRFIKWNEGTETVKDFSQWEDDDTDMPSWDEIPEKEVPLVTGLTGVYEFYHYPHEWDFLDVDILDLPEDKCTFEDRLAVSAGTADEETKKRVELSIEREKERERIEKIFEKRQKEEFLAKVRNKYLNKIDNPDNLVVKLVNKDYKSCSSNGAYGYEFAERYFGLDEDTYYESDGDPDLDEPVDDGPFTKEVDD